MSNGVLDLIGNTPLVEIKHLDRGKCRLFVKLESQNPGGSIKDRIALSMIEAAARDGRLPPGGTIVEATAGNTGLGLALIAALKGYKIILVVPDKMAREKIAHCKALGADVRITRSDVGVGHPEYYHDVARRIAGETGAFYIDQFSNPANPLAHEQHTAPEIWQQMNHDVDAIICGVGSGGTMTGLARYFARVSPHTEMVLADPVGSILEPLVNTGKMTKAGSWAVEGIGEDFIPANLDISVIKRAYGISDSESLQTARALLTEEGILAGSSSGTLMATALRYCREQTSAKRVVTFICDQGSKYLSKMFNDTWMLEQNFLHRPVTGTAEDLVIRRHDLGDAVVVRPDDTLLTVYRRMRSTDVSQLPVLGDNDRVIGIIQEDTIFRYLMTATDKNTTFAATAKAVMSGNFNVLEKHAPLKDATALLQQEPVLIVTHDGRFVGLITRVDLLNHLLLQERAA